MAAYPDSLMSDDLPLDPHGEEHIYDVAHGFLYRADEATSALWRSHSPSPPPHADDTTPSAAFDAADTVPPHTDDFAASAAVAGTRPYTMVNLATIPHDPLPAYDPSPLEPAAPRAFGSVLDIAALVDDAAGAPAASDEPPGARADHVLLAAWNQDSDDGPADAGGAYYAAAAASSDDEEWQAAGELQASDGDEDDEDEEDEEVAGLRGMWADDDDDDEEEEDLQESSGLGPYNTRTLVGSLLSRVGLHRLLASQQARRTHAREQQGPPLVEACPVPFLKGQLSSELRAVTDPLPPPRHGVHLMRARRPPLPLSLDELNLPMHDLGIEGGAAGGEDGGPEECPRRTRRSRSHRPSWLADMEPYHAAGNDDGYGLNNRGVGRALSWQHRLQQVVSQRIARARRADRGAEEDAAGGSGAGEAEKRTGRRRGDGVAAQPGACADAATSGSGGMCAPRRSARLRGTAESESAEGGTAGAVAGAEAGDGAGGDEAGHVIPPQPNVACMLHSRECGHDGRGGWNRAQQRHVAAVAHPPVHRVREIEARPAKAYIGKFSQRGDLFVAAYQDRRLRVFDTTGEDFKLRKDVEVRRFRWTVTDCAISRDSGFLLYSSISPQAHLVRIGAGGTDDVVHSVSNITEVHEEIDFLADVSSIRMSIGVWSLAWSPADSIVAAGTSQPGIILYDLAAERRLVAASCHHDDVNAVAFADASGNLLVSGSDDSRLFLHDRRTMRGELARPEGQLLGHTEGVTHVDARGDGRFVISNAKDSTVRLWDLRHMTPGSKVIPEHDLCSLSHFDYRWHEYPHAGMVASRPMDNSIMTFRGHKVLQTLIRAYWAPPATTGGRCIYTGSADGSVYVYDTVTGHVQHELRHHADVVRDCSWHPHRQQLVSVSWDGSIVEWGPRQGRTFSPSMLVHDYW